MMLLGDQHFQKISALFGGGHYSKILKFHKNIPIVLTRSRAVIIFNDMNIHVHIFTDHT